MHMFLKVFSKIVVKVETQIVLYFKNVPNFGFLDLVGIRSSPDADSPNNAFLLLIILYIYILY